MFSALAPMVRLGRIELDAADYVLRPCSPLRQVRGLPYLLSLYSLINWWENHAAWGFGHEGYQSEDQGGLQWEVELTTTWCERSEIVELIDIADLAIQGVRLAIYPMDARGLLPIHCPTLLGVIKADACVGVQLEQRGGGYLATLLGFMTTEELLQRWQVDPPNDQGFAPLPIDQLEPIAGLPSLVARLQPFRDTSLKAHPEMQVEPPAISPPVLRERKSNKNFPAAPSEKLNQILQHLSTIGLSPFAVEAWDTQQAIEVLQDQSVCQKVLAAHRLISAFQEESEVGSQFR